MSDVEDVVASGRGGGQGVVAGGHEGLAARPNMKKRVPKKGTLNSRVVPEH